MEKISIETSLDFDRMLEILKILIDRGFTLQNLKDGLVSKISGKIELDFTNKIQILTFQPRSRYRFWCILVI